MSLAQKYRHRFGAHRGDSLILYVAAAAAFHIGLMAGSIAWTQSKDAVFDVAAIQPIDFVYLDPDAASEGPPTTERRANLDSAAGGQRKAGLPVDYGKAGIEVPSPEKGVDDKPLPNLNAVPSPILSNPSHSNSDGVVPARHATSSGSSNTQPSSGNKVEQSDSSPKAEVPVPNSPSVVPSALPPAPPSNRTAFIPLPDPPPDLTRTQASPSASMDSAFSNLPRLDSANPTPPAVVDSEDDQPPSRAPAPPNLSQPDPTSSLADAALPGQALVGLLNPNRTADGTAGVEAQRDPIWGDYQASLEQEIQHEWQRIRINVDTTREAKVRFTIDRNGHLVHLELTQSSGSDIADRAALQAIQAATPFESLPEAAGSEQITINFSFLYNVPEEPSSLRQ